VSSSGALGSTCPSCAVEFVEGGEGGDDHTPCVARAADHGGRPQGSLYHAWHSDHHYHCPASSCKAIIARNVPMSHRCAWRSLPSFVGAPLVGARHCSALPHNERHDGRCGAMRAMLGDAKQCGQCGAMPGNVYIGMHCPALRAPTRGAPTIMACIVAPQRTP